MANPIGPFFPLPRTNVQNQTNPSSFTLLHPLPEDQETPVFPKRDYVEEISNLVTEFWQSNNGTEKSDGTADGLVDCFRDSFSQSWFLTPFYAYSCTKHIDNSLMNRVYNFVAGAKDVTQITIDFAALFFLWYMTRVPARDNVYNIIMTDPSKLPVRLQTLAEKLTEVPELVIQLSLHREEQLDAAKEYVLIKPKNGEPFYITKDNYNLVAVQNGCQPIK